LKRKLGPMEPQDQLADVIVQEANRLNSIVTDFLNSARPATPNLMPCNVNDILEKNLSFLAPEIEKNSYKIHKRLATHVREIQADPGLLYEAFLNILMNAMQAMPAGGTITVELADREDTLTIVFSDEGKGIPEDVLKKIWRPFFTTKDKGSGLGLPIVKKIVEGHGGNVRVENGPEKGVQVIVTLPAGKVDREAMAA